MTCASLIPGIQNKNNSRLETLREKISPSLLQNGTTKTRPSWDRTERRIQESWIKSTSKCIQGKGYDMHKLKGQRLIHAVEKIRDGLIHNAKVKRAYYRALKREEKSGTLPSLPQNDVEARYLNFSS
jgi:hypothetical protein